MNTTDASSLSRSPSASTRKRLLYRWCFALVPTIALAELVAHFIQVRATPTDDDWKQARIWVQARVQAKDLIVFSPHWVDPVGRTQLGEQLVSIEHTARADESKFHRAIEVSERGQHQPWIKNWRHVETQKIGHLTIGIYENPAPANILDDLLQRIDPNRLKVSIVTNQQEQECSITQTNPQSGGLFAGTATPGHRFVCSSGAFVGISVLTALDYSPRRCIYTTTPGGNTLLRLKFQDITLSRILYGYHGISATFERDRSGPPIRIAFYNQQHLLGEAIHNDGDGWKHFEINTSTLTGQRDDLTVEITSSSARQYCFTADTR